MVVTRSAARRASLPAQTSTQHPIVASEDTTTSATSQRVVTPGTKDASAATTLNKSTKRLPLAKRNSENATILPAKRHRSKRTSEIGKSEGERAETSTKKRVKQAQKTSDSDDGNQTPPTKSTRKKTKPFDSTPEKSANPEEKPRCTRKGKETASTMTQNILGLPREMWLHIFSFLYPSEVTKLAHVSKGLARYVEELFPWHHIHRAAKLPTLSPRSRKFRSHKAMVISFSDVVCEQCFAFSCPTVGHSAVRPLPVRLVWNDHGKEIRLCQPCRRAYFEDHPDVDIADPVKRMIPSRDGAKILMRDAILYYRMPADSLYNIPFETGYHRQYGTVYYLYDRSQVADAAACHHGGFIGLREEFRPFKYPHFRCPGGTNKANIIPHKYGPKKIVFDRIMKNELDAANKRAENQITVLLEVASKDHAEAHVDTGLSTPTKLL
ncbi:hypothetical protein DFQ27_003145 [Actinomortierella ambigua]|uniref:F-box domain-containing protein n=1 Tax=Actinomortierella ambigua TaxID=1343610 RepID=A0A9P6Q918_9FUNG|nr:hypothetical protein DFQ27_003145 [Actinomortierella ambigua]